MTCRGLIAHLADLSCGDLAPREMRESKRHLARCQSCAAYRRSYRATVELAREAYLPGGADGPEISETLIGGILTAARTRLSGLSPRAWHLVHLLSGIAAEPLLAFCLR